MFAGLSPDFLSPGFPNDACLIAESYAKHSSNLSVKSPFSFPTPRTMCVAEIPTYLVANLQFAKAQPEAGQ
jgi:hypothetical protein